jgi:hypothetical protein
MTDLRLAYRIQEFDSSESMYLLDDNKRKLYETAEKIKKKRELDKKKDLDKYFKDLKNAETYQEFRGVQMLKRDNEIHNVYNDIMVKKLKQYKNTTKEDFDSLSKIYPHTGPNVLKLYEEEKERRQRESKELILFVSNSHLINDINDSIMSETE